MNINFEGKYKSVENLTWNDIPKLAVITGKNGTGKSQLLDIIKASINQSWENMSGPLTLIPQITGENYRLEDLVYLKGEWALDNLGAIGLNSVQQERENIYGEFNIRLSDHGYALNSGNIKQRIIELSNLHTYKSLYNFFDKLILENSTITKDEFLNLIPNNLITDKRQQASNSNIGKVFYNYRLDLIEAKSKGLSEDQFIQENSEKPWIQINQLFNEMELPFELNNPEEVNMRDMYTPVIRNSLTKETINFSDLSSGERVLVSLVFWLFNSNDKGVFPKILLLDEPDAHLHPSMTKQFLHILNNVLCLKYDVRVILTTHSPSTVAIAPEESLFIMKKDGDRIEKVMKDSALAILTSGVPSFSVNYENRRQVFVESPNDVLFYEKLYQKLSNKLIPEISLSFISSGESRTDKHGIKIANCKQVINICQSLRSTGNRFIWGIIDWDQTNEPGKYDYIKVLGNGERYAIENYLFDPVLISALLLREKIISRNDLGLQDNQNYTDFKNLDKFGIQAISNFLVDKIAEKINPENHETSRVIYLNGIEIDIPKWYLHCQGHLLEDTIVNVFPTISSIKKGKEELLKLEIIDKIVDDIPELIPRDILKIFQHIQTS